MPPSPDDAFLQARQAALRNDPVKFEAAAAQTAGHPLAEYIDYWRLRLHLGLQPRNTQGSDGSADPDIRAFLRQHPGTLVADLLRRDWMLDLGRRGQWSTLDEEYALWVLHDDSAVDCRRWQSDLAQGRPLPAQANATLLRARDPGQACGALIEDLFRSGTRSRKELDRILHASLEANAAGSIRKIAGLLELPSEAVDRALEKPALALARNDDPTVLVIAAARLARQDPERAIEMLPDLRLAPREQAFVTAQAAASAMRRLSPRALEFTRQALDAEVADDTLEWLARAALRDGDWKTLDAVIARMSPAGRSEPAWVYWRARSLKALDQPEQANEALRSIADRFEFYGQLAAEELGILTAIPTDAAPRTRQELAEPERNPGFARALKFYELGLRFEGNREWNYQLRGMNDRQLLASADWACSRSILDRCVNTADRTRQEHDFKLRFVTPFIEQLAPVARERGLDPAWVYGLIRQESRFIMDARSSANAQGLMQIIPTTARWIAGKLGVTGFQLRDLHQIDTNVNFGTFYLKSVLDDLDGSPVLASAGYNAGPGRPRNWRTTLPGTVEGAVFAEIIPFAETRGYVKNVLSNATFYSALLSGKPQSLKQRLGHISPTGSPSRANLP